MHWHFQDSTDPSSMKSYPKLMERPHTRVRKSQEDGWRLLGILSLLLETPPINMVLLLVYCSNSSHAPTDSSLRLPQPSKTHWGLNHLVILALWVPYSTTKVHVLVCFLLGATNTDAAIKSIQCAIQACLQKNGYNESRCGALIDALYECCSEMYKREGLAAKNVCCPQESLLKLKLKQRADEKATGAEIQETRRR